jgi:hypothetical protein
MNRTILVICDREEEYCCRLDGYLREHLDVSFEIVDYTDPDMLTAFPRKKETAVLIIAQNAFEQTGTAGFDRILVLDENETTAAVAEPGTEYAETTVEHTDKYQSTEQIVRKLLDFCMKFPDGAGQKGIRGRDGAELIGFYSPVGRCLQTTFAMTMGKILSEKEKTLYLNFEPYAGRLAEETEEDSDLSDLLYYHECSPDKMPLYLEKVRKNIGGPDLVPPVKNLFQLSEIRITQWTELLLEIQKTAKYRYILLDLSEIVHMFPELLRMCSRVYTIARADEEAAAKMRQYEKMLQKSGFADVADHTLQLKLPAQAELTAYIRQLLSDEEKDHAGI